MGTWNTGILDDDLAADVCEDYLTLHEQGRGVDEIRKTVEQKYSTDLDEVSFWLGLSEAQWRCKSLQKDVHETVRRMVDNDEDDENWKETDAPTRLRRKRVLVSFLKKLSKPARVGKTIDIKSASSLFEKGTCLALKISNGEYGAALVVDSTKVGREKINVIGVFNYKAPQKPPLSAFERTDWLMRNGSPAFFGCASHTNEDLSSIESIGVISLSDISIPKPRLFTNVKNLAPHVELYYKPT